MQSVISNKSILNARKESDKSYDSLIFLPNLMPISALFHGGKFFFIKVDEVGVLFGKLRQS